MTAAKKVSSLVAFAALACASSACAITFYFNSGGTQTGSFWNNQRTFTVDGLSVTASALSYNPSSSSWSSGYLGQNLYGLTNLNSWSDNAHYVDNSGWIDFVRFEFSESVARKQLYTVVSGDGDFDYWTGTSVGAPQSGGTSVSNGSPGWSSLSEVTDLPADRLPMESSPSLHARPRRQLQDQEARGRTRAGHRRHRGPPRPRPHGSRFRSPPFRSLATPTYT